MFYIIQVLYLYLFGSVLVIRHLSINLTEAGVMHEAGNFYTISSTWHHLPFWILYICQIWIITSCPHFTIWEVLLAIAR